MRCLRVPLRGRPRRRLSGAVLTGASPARSSRAPLRRGPYGRLFDTVPYGRLSDTVPYDRPVDESAAPHADGTLRGEAVVLVPVGADHVAALHRILATEPERRRWGEEASSPRWPFDDAVRFAVLAGGAVRGMVQYAEENEPAYRHASIDIFLDPPVHNHGLGRDAVRTLARHLVQIAGITGSPATPPSTIRRPSAAMRRSASGRSG